ncbi:MAG: radical SAM protein, partial [Ktedonobacteraceae bacterium]
MDTVPGGLKTSLPHLRVSLYGDCNMRCIYCAPWGENGYTIAHNLDSASLKRILDRLSQMGFELVKFTGGEPTLRKDLTDIIQFSSTRFRETRIITNGWNLSTIAPSLRASGLSSLEISMDAADPVSYVHMTQTSPAMYNAVRAGIAAAKQLGFPIQINMVLMQQNFDQIEPMLALVTEIGDVTLKILELVYYEYPGYEFWQRNFVSMDEVIPIVRRHSEESAWTAPPGNIGSPSPVFHLQNGARIIIKDGKVGTSYASICDGCPLFPCQDGLYGLTLTHEGYLKMCKHRTDLYIPLFEMREGERIVTD